MTKKYIVANNDTWWEIMVEIDHEKADRYIKEQVEFWADWESGLKGCGGDYTKLFLKRLGYKVWREVAYHSWCLAGIIDLFNEEEEGWYKMDGTYGVNILSVDEECTDKDSFEVKTI